MQPTELTAEQLDNIRVRARVEGNATFTALLSHADAIAAKVARLEGERDAARKVLRDVQWSGEANTCPSCEWDGGEHYAYCELADAIDPDRHEPKGAAHVAHD